MSLSESDMRRALSELSPPQEAEAEERAWRTIALAHRELSRERSMEGEELGRAPRVLPRARLALRAAVGLVAISVVALLISPAGAKVREWVSDRLTGSGTSQLPALTTPPGGGSLLVESGRGSWVVGSDGSKRLLGRFSDPTWSPNGLFVVAVDRHQLTALEPDGDLRWALARPGRVLMPSWNAPDGYRIAYLEREPGGQGAFALRVVAGDGSGDRLFVSRAAPVQPAWRPGPEHRLAFALPGGRVVVAPVDSDAPGRDGDRGGEGFVLPDGAEVEGLEWSRDGSRLIAWTASSAVLLDSRGRVTWRYRPPRDGTIQDAILAGGSRVALLEGGATSEAVITGPNRSRQVLFAAPGRLTDLTLAPDGDWLLVGWPDADQWLFLRPGRQGRVRSVSGISAQFAPGATSPAAFPRVHGWCCR